MPARWPVGSTSSRPSISRSIPNERYTFWSGLLGGMFLALSYFGTDQSQVQRYIGGASLRESRLGLMFNAVCKIPMQFFILLLGVLLFVFYQFEQTAGVLQPDGVEAAAQRRSAGASCGRSKQKFAAVHARKAAADPRAGWRPAHAATPAAEAQRARRRWRRRNAPRPSAQRGARRPGGRDPRREDQRLRLRLHHLHPDVPAARRDRPAGRGHSSPPRCRPRPPSSTRWARRRTIDLYRHIVRSRRTTTRITVAHRKWFTALWGLVAIGFALFASLAENLIQAVNIVGSIFYGVVLGAVPRGVLSATGRRHGGVLGGARRAGAASSFSSIFALSISYLWYNLIGCAACVLFSVAAASRCSARPQRRRRSVPP